MGEDGDGELFGLGPVGEGDVLIGKGSPVIGLFGITDVACTGGRELLMGPERGFVFGPPSLRFTIGGGGGAELSIIFLFFLFGCVLIHPTFQFFIIV